MAASLHISREVALLSHFPFDMEAVRRHEANRHLALSHSPEADPAGVPGSCHYQRKVGIQPSTVFYAFERCRLTAAHGTPTDSFFVT